MTVHQRIRTGLVAWLTLGPALLYMTVEVSKYYALGSIALLAVVAGYAMTRRCPKCAKPPNPYCTTRSNLATRSPSGCGRLRRPPNVVGAVNPFREVSAHGSW